MPNQVAPKLQYIHIPDGCDMEIKLPTDSTWLSVGTLEGDTTMEHTWESYEYNAANAENVLEFMKSQQVNMSATLVEVNLEVISKMGGDLYTVENVAGTPVTGYSDTITAGFAEDTWIEIGKQNGDKSILSMTSVTNGGALVAGTDYIITKGPNGNSGIVFLSGGSADPGQDAVLVYDYTPNEAVKMFAGTTTVESQQIQVRFTNTNSAGKIRRFSCSKSFLQPTFTYTFGSQTNDTPETVPITIRAGLDDALDDGKQLFEIYDEQGV